MKSMSLDTPAQLTFKTTTKLKANHENLSKFIDMINSGTRSIQLDGLTGVRKFLSDIEDLSKASI